MPKIHLLIALLIMMSSAAQAVDDIHSIAQDANAWLTSAYRCDLPGPEVWTAPMQEKTVCDGEKEWNKNIPFRAFGLPSPGLNGLLHVVHQVPNLYNAITLDVEEDGKAAVEFLPVRNRWTPSFCTTHYRSKPTSVSPFEVKDVGRLVLKETKAILEDNTFLAQTTIKNTSPTTLVCRVAIKTNGDLPKFGEAARAWNFTTYAMMKRKNRTTFVAARSTFEGAEKSFAIPAHGETTFRYALSFSPVSAADAALRVEKALRADDAFEANARAFNAWFTKNVPALETGSPDLQRMYLYRWFVVKRGTHEARRVIANHEYPRTAVYESPVGGWYNCVIGLPVPLQIQELSWQRDPSVLHAHILNWNDKVVGYRDYIQFTPMAIARSFENHPSSDLAKRVLNAAANFARERSGGNPSKLPVQYGSWMTGAEYQPNFYQFTNPQWDFRNDTELRGKSKGLYIAQLVRLDTAAFSIGNLLGAAKIAELAHDTARSAELRDFAESQLDVVLKSHWSEKVGLFLSADPKTYQLADEAACYDSFAPFMWGIVKDEKYLRAFDKFIDRAWFWDDFPVSTVAKNCPMYCGENALINSPASPQKQHLYTCSWNGPTWHYSNSLMAESFGQAAMRRAELREKWLEFFDAWSEMHYLYGDRTAPRAAESVRPTDGARCNNAWDYFHSSWLDPFFRYYLGIQLSQDGKEILFEPFTEGDFKVSNVPLCGREFSFEQRTKNGFHHLTIRDAKGKILVTGKTKIRVSSSKR
jgi:hypothetical protein